MWSTLLELDKINEGIYDIESPRLTNWVTANGQRVTLKNPISTVPNTKVAASTPNTYNTYCIYYVVATVSNISINSPDFCEFDPNDPEWQGAVAYLNNLTPTTGLFTTLKDARNAAENGHFIFEYDPAAKTLDFVEAVKKTVKPSQQTKPANGKYVVVIISDKGRLRAFGTDWVNPAAFVVFPNHLRQYEGQKYEVDQLIWNGKNYRVAGNIRQLP